MAYKKLSQKNAFGKSLNIRVAWAEPLNDPDEKDAQVSLSLSLSPPLSNILPMCVIHLAFIEIVSYAYGGFVTLIRLKLQMNVKSDDLIRFNLFF